MSFASTMPTYESGSNRVNSRYRQQRDSSEPQRTQVAQVWSRVGEIQASWDANERAARRKLGAERRFGLLCLLTGSVE